MEDGFFAVHCPTCRQSLLEAGLTAGKVVAKWNCPYCGLAVRWARLPLLLAVTGLALAGSGAFSRAFDEALFFPTQIWATAGIAGGATLFLLGLLCLRIESVKSSKRSTADDTRLYYPNLG